MIEQFKHARPMALSVVKELTELVPKTAWTTRIRITETGADIEGYAKSASALLPILERSQYFRKVEFSSPIMRDVKMDADRFAIKMEIKGSSPPARESAASPDGAAAAPQPAKTSGPAGEGKKDETKK